jgi:hypothetical protein
MTLTFNLAVAPPLLDMSVIFELHAARQPDGERDGGDGEQEEADVERLLVEDVGERRDQVRQLGRDVGLGRVLGQHGAERGNIYAERRGRLGAGRVNTPT